MQLRATSDEQERWLERGSNRAEWQRLVSAIELVDGFQFLAVHVGDRVAASFITELVAAHIDELPQCHILLGPHSRVSELLDQMRAAPRPCLFWLVGDAPGPALGSLFSLLNQKREVVSEISGGPFVIALHPLAWSHFRRCAPDFWSIHQAVFRFSPADELPIEHVDRGVRDDESRAHTRPRATSTWRLDEAEIDAFQRPGFFGRDAELRLVRSALREPGARILIWGPAGIGKTTLVEQLLPSIAKRYPAGIWIVPIDPQPSVAQTYASSLHAELLSELRPSVRPPSDPDALRRLYLLATSEHPVLLVFDDLEDAELLKLMLPGPGASVIVTSRAALEPGRFDRVIKLGGLAVKDAAAMLTRTRGVDVANPLEVAHALGGNPTLMRRAAAPIMHDASGQLDLSRLSNDARSLWARLGWFIGVFDRADAQALSGWTAQRTRAALDELETCALVELVAPQRYRSLNAHPPEELEALSAESREVFLGYARRVLVDWRVPPDDPNVHVAVRWLLTMLESKQFADVADEAWEILRGGVLRLSAWPWAPSRLMEVGMAIAQQRGDFSVLAAIYAWYAENAANRTELEAARTWRERQLDALEHAQGPPHEGLIHARLNLAWHLTATDPDAARRHIERAVELADQLEILELQVRARVRWANSGEDPDVTRAALSRALQLAGSEPSLLVEVYAALARHSEAREDARRWIERALDLDAASAWLAGDLGEQAESRSELDLAARAYGQALRGYERIGDDEMRAHTLAALGELASARGDLETARHSFEQARELDEQLGQPGFTLVPLARLDRLGGDLDAAVAKLIQAHDARHMLDTVLVLDELRACYEAATDEPARARLRAQWEAAGLDWDGVLD